MRASSLDASLLDSELHSLLLSPLHTALKFFHPTFISNYDPELVALLRLSLWKVGIWDSNTSYGSLIQNLHYRTIQNGRSVPPTRRQKFAYAGLTVLLPYILSKTESYLTLSNDTSPARWKERLQRFITNAENIFSSLSLLNFLAFLVDGRYRSITDRILKLRLLPLTKSQHHHLLSYEFLNRQLTWTSLTEFLLFILPLILPSYRRIRRKIVRTTMVGGSGVLNTLPERFCGICFSQGREGRLVTNPYVGECGHVYCYACLIGEVVGEQGDGWGCLRCGHVIRHIRRWDETVEKEGEQRKEESPTEDDETVNEKLSKEEDEDEDEDEMVEVHADSPEIESEEGVSGDEDAEDSNEENLFSRS